MIAQYVIESFVEVTYIIYRINVSLKLKSYCGRGGIGRRAALRSLSGNTGGSSSLLDRTKVQRDENKIGLYVESSVCLDTKNQVYWTFWYSG